MAKISTGAISHDSGAAAVIVGQYMYVAGGNGLAVFDIVSDPFNPGKVGKTISTGALSHGGGSSMLIRDEFLYIAGGNGLSVFSLRNPLAPTKIGETIKTGAFMFFLFV